MPNYPQGETTKIPQLTTLFPSFVQTQEGATHAHRPLPLNFLTDVQKYTHIIIIQ